VIMQLCNIHFPQNRTDLLGHDIFLANEVLQQSWGARSAWVGGGTGVLRECSWIDSNPDSSAA
jgi:hypothetical protein